MGSYDKLSRQGIPVNRKPGIHAFSVRANRLEETVCPFGQKLLPLSPFHPFLLLNTIIIVNCG